MLSIFADIQGRVAAGPATAITATTSAVTTIGALQIGDRVRAGQVVATQDPESLRRQLDLLTAQLAEARLRLAQTEQGMADDRVLIMLLEEHLELLNGKSQRAQTLASKNAVSADAVDTARSAEIRARETLAQRRAALASKTYQQKLGTAAISRITLQINALKQDIADTKITAPSDGQIIFIHPSQVGFNRTGDVLMRTRAIDDFEIEVDIPLEYLGFVAMTKSLKGMDFAGTGVDLQLRVILPVQNLRTGTQTARFAVAGALPRSLLLLLQQCRRHRHAARRRRCVAPRVQEWAQRSHQRIQPKPRHGRCVVHETSRRPQHLYLQLQRLQPAVVVAFSRDVAAVEKREQVIEGFAAGGVLQRQRLLV